MEVSVWLGEGPNAVQRGKNLQEALRHFPKDGLIVGEDEGLNNESGDIVKFIEDGGSVSGRIDMRNLIND